MKDNWFKICIVILGIVIAIGVISYLNGKNSLAYQRNIQEQQEKALAFDADQKESCLAIYKQESSKWNNVNGWRYDSVDDTCYIEYKDPKKKTQKQCDADLEEAKTLTADGTTPSWAFSVYIHCIDGTFEKSF